jgi:DNA-binding GntR family transcriptional regulator
MKDTITRQSFLEKQNMSEDLVSYIKQQILDGILNPGDRIVETKLAKDLGISQTPVREAIRQLSGEGIITIIPNKGPVVQSLNMKDVFEIYSLRASLEGLAIRLATHEATDVDIRNLELFYKEQMKDKLEDESVQSLLKESMHIHQSIINFSNHSRLIRSYKSIFFQISLVGRILGRESTKKKEIEQHWELINALIKRDAGHAEVIMKKHIYRSYCEFSELLKDGDRRYGANLWFTDKEGE